MKLTADQLRDVAAAIDVFSKVRRDQGVEIAGYGAFEIRHVESTTVLRLSWDTDSESYVVDDRVGG